MVWNARKNFIIQSLFNQVTQSYLFFSCVRHFIFILDGALKSNNQTGVVHFTKFSTNVVNQDVRFGFALKLRE